MLVAARSMLLGLLTSAAIAQLPSRPHVVAVRQPGNQPATQLVGVDAQSGQVTVRGRFDGDTLPPLAIALDPYDGQVLLALDTQTGSSRIVRLAGDGSPLATVLAEVPGAVVDLVVQGDALLLATDAADGGVYRMPRRGGDPLPIYTHANVTALAAFALDNSAMLIAWSGRPGTSSIDSGVATIDSATGALLAGPVQLPTVVGREITGIADLPTGLPRQLLSYNDGSFEMVVGGGLITQPVPVTPAPPPGGAVSMRALNATSFGGLVLGGSALPALYEVDVFSNTAALRSNLIPGTPVDFAPGQTLAGQALSFGEACGTPVLRARVLGSLQPGTVAMFEVSGPTAGTFAALVAGTDDFAGVLPLPVFGTCLLHVRPDVVVLKVANAVGTAQHPLPVPFSAGLIGARLFTQWVVPGAASFGVAPAHSVQIGF